MGEDGYVRTGLYCFKPALLSLPKVGYLEGGLSNGGAHHAYAAVAYEHTNYLMDKSSYKNPSYNGQRKSHE